MGNTTSSTTSSALDAHARLLAEAAGRGAHARDAPLWSRLLTPPAPLAGVAGSVLEDAVAPYFDALGEGVAVVGGWLGAGRVERAAPGLRARPPPTTTPLPPLQ